MNKSVILAICALFVIAVGASSCTDKLNQPGYNGFRCAFGNKEYIADTSFYQRIGNQTVLHAQTAGKDVFVMYLVSRDTVGSLALDSVLNTAYYYDNSTNPRTAYRSANGTVAITEYFNDSLATMSGSFSFTGIAPTNSLYFSDGYFNNVPRH